MALHCGLEIPVRPFTDSGYRFDVTSKGSKTSEKSLVLEIDGVREGFRTYAISGIGF